MRFKLNRFIFFGTATDYPFNTGNIGTDKSDIVINDDYSLRKAIINDKEVYGLETTGKENQTTLKLNLLSQP